jgi:hypothetical protein
MNLTASKILPVQYLKLNRAPPSKYLANPWPNSFYPLGGIHEESVYLFRH